MQCQGKSHAGGLLVNLIFEKCAAVKTRSGDSFEVFKSYKLRVHLLVFLKIEFANHTNIL